MQHSLATICRRRNSLTYESCAHIQQRLRGITHIYSVLFETVFYFYVENLIVNFIVKLFTTRIRKGIVIFVHNQRLNNREEYRSIHDLIFFLPFFLLVLVDFVAKRAPAHSINRERQLCRALLEIQMHGQ